MHGIYMVFLWFLLIHSTKCHWVDPFDMLGYNHATKSRDQSANKITEGLQMPENLSCNSIEERNFIKRFINLLLENSGITKEDMHYGGRPSLLEVKIDINKLEYLQSMLKYQNYSLQELDQTMTSIIFPYELQQSLLHHFMDISWPSNEQWHNIFILLTAILPIVVLFTFNGLKRIIMVMPSVYFTASYYITYQKLLQEAKINQYISLSKEIPAYCSGDGDSFVWNMIKNILTSSDDSCTKHLQTAKIDARYQITPFRVVVHIISEPFLYLMENFGLHFSKFSNNILSEMSWLCGPIALICASLMILYIIVLSIAMMFGQNTKLLGFQTFQRNLNVSRIEDIHHRQMIEELSTVPNRPGKDAIIKGNSIEEISVHFKCDSCQKLANISDSSIEVSNIDEQQMIRITEVNKDMLQETKNVS